MSSVKEPRKAMYMNAVIDQLMSTGITDLSLRELSSQIGVNHRVLIYHFGSKENLVNEVVQEVRRRERELFKAREPLHNGDPVSRLTAFFEHNLSSEMRPYFSFFYQMWGMAQMQPERYARFLEGIVSVWIDALSETFVNLGYTADDAVTRSTFVLGALRGLQIDLFATGEEDRVRTSYESLIALLAEGAPHEGCGHHVE